VGKGGGAVANRENRKGKSEVPFPKEEEEEEEEKDAEDDETTNEMMDETSVMNAGGGRFRQGSESHNVTSRFERALE